MGVCADACAEKYEFSREAQDAYAIQSYNRSATAWDSGKFDNEVVPVEVPQRRGAPVIVSKDEEYSNVRMDKIPQLRPAFTKDGTVTAANASTINDGAGAMVLMSKDKAEALGLNVDYFEFNEAFSVVGLANMKILGLTDKNVNVNGGAVSLGHPLGCSGVRILITLLNILEQNNALSIVPLRNEPTDTSELISQVIYGDFFKVIEKRKKWVKIRLAFDKYEGWIDVKQYFEISEEQYKTLLKEAPRLATDFVEFIEDESQQLFPITIGSTLNGLALLNHKYDGHSTDKKADKSNLIQTAYAFLNAPYLWGGKTPFGIDCSGFTQMVYKLNGYKLLRDASQQATQGEAHAHGKVRIDRLDHSGIYNVDTNLHSHKLRVIKKIV